MQHCKVCLPEVAIKSSITLWQPQERKESGLCFFKARSRFSLDTTNDLCNRNMSHTEVISEVTKSWSLYSLKSTPEFCLEAHYWLVWQSTADLSHEGSVLKIANYLHLSHSPSCVLCQAHETSSPAVLVQWWQPDSSTLTVSPWFTHGVKHREKSYKLIYMHCPPTNLISSCVSVESQTGSSCSSPSCG